MRILLPRLRRDASWLAVVPDELQHRAHRRAGLDRQMVRVREPETPPIPVMFHPPLVAVMILFSCFALPLAITPSTHRYGQWCPGCARPSAPPPPGACPSVYTLPGENTSHRQSVGSPETIGASRRGCSRRANRPDVPCRSP